MKNFARPLALAFFTLTLASCGDGIAKDKSVGGGSSIFGLKVDGGQPVRRIFVTTRTFAGNLGGVAGADLACNADPARPAGARAFKALLTDSRARIACLTANCAGGGVGEHVDWVLTPNMLYVRPDGTYVGRADGLGLLSFPLANAFSFVPSSAWTGLKDNYTGSIYHCQHFTSTASAYGNLGRVNSVTGQAIDDAFGGCAAASNPLVCVEQ